MAKPKKNPGAKDLGTWILFNKAIMKMGEEEVSAQLEQERAGKARLMYMLRLNARLSKLRRERERKEIAKGAK
jgi:hypothetical protein